MFKTLQFRILRGFIIIMALFVFWGFAYHLFDTRREDLNALINQSREIQRRQLFNIQNFQLFQLLGYKDTVLYQSGKQEYLEDFRRNTLDIKKEVKELQSWAIEEDLPYQKLALLEESLNQLTDSVAKLSSLYIQRGFKDFGLEGQMREAIHLIEQEKLLPPAQYLSFRRHEKDFINRNQWEYVKLFNLQYQRLLKEMEIIQGSRLDSLLSAYRLAFNQFAAIQAQISLEGKKGLVETIANMNTDLEAEFDLALSGINKELNALQGQVDKLINILGVLMILLILIYSYSLSRRISGDLKEFGDALRKYTSSDFKTRGLFKDLKSGTLEVQELLEDFRKMNQKLQASLTELKLAARKSERTAKVKSYFLANMSHEIRTPLNGVLGMIHLLKDTHDPAQRAEYMRTIEFSAEHLGDLVNMILDFSKIDAGKMELNPQSMNLEEVIHNLVQMFRFKAEENHNRLILDRDTALEHLIIADSLRLQQIFINLISNALKFTKDGEVRIIIRELSTENKANCKLYFAVQDSGIGIPEKKLKSLFDAYSQTDRSIQKEFGGTGLGLAITHELIKLMGSQLEVKSRIAIGSTFSFSLEFPKGSTKLNDLDNPYQSPAHLSQKVLVAEDNEVNQKVLGLLLERQGLNVQMVKNGKEALEAYESEDFGLILMDLQMPIMDGLEATREIIASAKYQSRPCPIVAVTANAFEEDKREALLMGCQDFIPKPIKPDELHRVLRKYLILNSLS